MAIRVYLIDDHPVVAAGLKLGFSLTGAYEVVGVARTPGAALDTLKDAAPDIIVSDLVMEGAIDWTCLRLYREMVPDARLIVFSSLDPQLYSERCVREGADGFISKSVAPHDMERAIRDMLDGSGEAATLPTCAQDADVLPLLDGVRLTKRELEVARLLAQGSAVSDVAAALGISKKTAAIHRDNLKAKLACNTSTALVAVLARLGPHLEGGSA